MTRKEPQQLKDKDRSSFEQRMQFLTSQIQYLTSHFQIADTKAAGIIAYLSLLTSYTVGKLDISRGVPMNATKWLAGISLIIGGCAIVLALLVILPRFWRKVGVSDETYSWIGLSKMSESTFYPNRVTDLTTEEM